MALTLTLTSAPRRCSSRKSSEEQALTCVVRVRGWARARVGARARNRAREQALTHARMATLPWP